MAQRDVIYTRMDLASHFYLYRRNWLAIFAITVLVAAVTYFAAARTGGEYGATLFLSIGTKQNAAVSTSFDDVQAADYFADTVQGWLKNPELLRRIEEKAQSGAQFSARKQEKQNLLITWESASEEEARRISQAITEELRQEIEKYNTETESGYTLALTGTTIAEAPSKNIIFLVLGLVAGLALGIALAYVYEFLFGVVSFRHQAEKILKKSSDETLKPGWKKRELGYLGARIKKMPHKSTLVLGVNTATDALARKLKGEAESSIFPEDAQDLTNDKNIVLVCRPGRTTWEDLEKILPLLPENYLLVTLYSQ